MKSRALIVGAGAIGLASALELAKAGYSVTVLEREHAGMEATWAGAGILSGLPPWAYAKPVTALIQAGIARHADWFRELHEASGIDPEFRRSGLLILNPRELDSAATWCAEYGVECEAVHGDTLLPPGALDRPGMWLPDICQVRNPRLGRALAGAAHKMGVTLREGVAVTGFLTRKGHCTAVRTATGTEYADLIVVCAGAWSRLLLGSYAGDAMVVPVLGQMLALQAEPGWLSPIVFRDGFYLVPRADGHILVGATLEFTHFDKSTTDEAKDLLLERAVAIHGRFAELPVVRHWAGLRPGSAGNVPVIDRHPHVDNLYLNTGHFRYGVTMAPAAAEILRRRVTGETQFLDVSPYAWPRPVFA